MAKQALNDVDAQAAVQKLQCIERGLREELGRVMGDRRRFAEEIVSLKKREKRLTEALKPILTYRQGAPYKEYMRVEAIVRDMKVDASV